MAKIELIGYMHIPSRSTFSVHDNMLLHLDLSEREKQVWIKERIFGERVNISNPGTNTVLSKGTKRITIIIED